METTSENIQLSLTFGQVFDMVKNLPRKRKVQLFNYLQVDLSAPKKIDIDDLYKCDNDAKTSESNNNPKKTLVDYELLEMLDEIEVEEPEMTDEEFYKAIKEMD